MAGDGTPPNITDMERDIIQSFVILHADDNRDARTLLNRVCADEPGCEVIQVKTGSEAWRLLDAGIRPNLCMLDLAMPELDGLSLLRRMRADRRFAKMPVMLCAAVHERAAIDVAAELGVDYFLVKPYSAALVRERIRRVRLAQSETADGESVVAFSARMGVDIATGQKILDEFAGEIHVFVAEVKVSIARLDYPAVAKLIGGLKVTANCLGITSVFVELSQMERIVTTLDKSPMGLPVDGNTTMLRRWQVEAGCRGCDPGLARLRQTALSWAALQVSLSAEAVIATAVNNLEPADVVA